MNAIAPGLIRTGMTKLAFETGDDYFIEDGLISQTPLGRAGQPDDIAPAAVYLASDEAQWITGEVIGVSGGA